MNDIYGLKCNYTKSDNDKHESPTFVFLHKAWIIALNR